MANPLRSFYILQADKALKMPFQTLFPTGGNVSFLFRGIHIRSNAHSSVRKPKLLTASARATAPQITRRISWWAMERESQKCSVTRITPLYIWLTGKAPILKFQAGFSRPLRYWLEYCGLDRHWWHYRHWSLCWIWRRSPPWWSHRSAPWLRCDGCCHIFNGCRPWRNDNIFPRLWFICRWFFAIFICPNLSRVADSLCHPMAWSGYRFRSRLQLLVHVCYHCTRWNNGGIDRHFVLGLQN